VHIAGELGRDVVRGDERGGGAADLLDVLHHEVVEVRVRDEDHVGGWRVVGDAPRVDVQREAVAVPAVRRLLEPGEPIQHLPHLLVPDTTLPTPAGFHGGALLASPP
jgi:hypothetical protein